MGYLKRENYRKWSARVFTRFRPKNNFGILEVRPHINYDGYWKLNGFHESGRWHIDNHWEFRSGFEIHTGINLVKEGVLETFEIADYVYLLGPSENGAVLIGSGTPKEITKNDNPFIQQFIHGRQIGPVEFHYPAEERKKYFFNK